jgi:predicted ATPase
MVGLNGVGKTQVMARLAMLMSRFSKKNEKEKTSTLETEGALSPVPSIYNVVAISFSAFDEFERPTILQGEKFRYSYCGLRSQRGRLLSEDDLLENIRRIVTDELDDGKRLVLAEALTQIIRVENIQSFVNDPEGHRTLYERLSAGQRIALNALCHTLAKLEPRTLVLFDEPELHLHPQLLTTMMSAFMDLLKLYDSFAVVATHSPIVIQQIPSRCVHIVRRDRMKPMVLKPRFEAFGETLTEITRQVFTSTESDRDYKTTLDVLLKDNGNDVERVEAIFDGKLSMNARIYLESRRESTAEK